MAREQHQDGVEQVWQRFFTLRTTSLNKRFQGRYRAVVVETNDPLQMHRVRIKIPELHNDDLKSEHYPWAITSPWMGGSGCGSWVSPIIDDQVWVEFEKGEPYSPVVVGFADPTRRKFYVLESIFGKTPLSVNKEGKPADKPDDYLEDYLPKDNRPMSLGWRDRYGSFSILNSSGFFPKEHDEKPAPTGQDAVSKSKFDASKKKPVANDPDTKYAATCTKYGNFMVLNDVGYIWKKDGSTGEFKGDFEEDREFEIKRSKYLQKLFTENAAKDVDQRRFELRTRYGHKFEMRDVGWKKTRAEEYDDSAREIANGDKDERWFKLRTKGGHLIQMWDFGCDPVDDLFVKRKLLEEVGDLGDHEDVWQGREDARQLRFVSRYGFKIAIDDRGSDKTDATGKEDPRGNGIILKGRRTPEENGNGNGENGNGENGNGNGAGGEGRGFGMEFNEKDELNTMRHYTPKSKIFEMNDKHDYIILCTDTDEKISEPWKNLDDNEFARKVAMTFDPEKDTHHLKLDKKNGYIRLKTAEKQGIEMRDGDTGWPWVEVRDMQDRGLLLSKVFRRVVLRAQLEQPMYVIMDDNSGNLLVHNATGGRTQVYSTGPVEIKSDQNINLHAGGGISLKAGSQICMEAGGAHATLKPGAFGADVTANFPTVLGFLPQAKHGDGAQSSSPLSCSPPSVGMIPPGFVRPEEFDKDRGKISQDKEEDFKEVDIKVIWGEA